MKPLRFTAALAIVLGVLLPLASGADGNVDRLKQQSSNAADRIEGLSASLNEDRAGLDRAARKAKAASAREAELAGEIEAGAKRVAGIETELQKESSNLVETRDRLRRAERLLAGRLAAIYIAGPVEAIDLVFGSASFTDLTASAEYITSIHDADQQLASRVRSVRNSLKATVERLGSLKEEADAKLAALSTARAEIASAREQAEASAAEFASISSSRRQEIDELRADIQQWERQIQRQGAGSADQAQEDVAAFLGGPYSIPTYIVMCESGGNYSALNPSSGAGGAYQIIPSTWEAYGGTGLPHLASKAEQDRIAALIYAESGTAPWVCG